MVPHWLFHALRPSMARQVVRRRHRLGDDHCRVDARAQPAQKDENPVIRFEGVSKSYFVRGGRHTILDDVTFALPSRCRIGILGANGAGKSALLRLIAGGEMPDSGKIVREGRVSFPVGFTGTFNSLLSARENVTFLARVYGM